MSDDGGETWADAELVPDLPDPSAWSGWTFRLGAGRAGAYTFCCRATDETGESQPLEPEWNLGGYENNAVQRVPVVVADDSRGRDASSRERGSPGALAATTDSAHTQAEVGRRRGRRQTPIPVKREVCRPRANRSTGSLIR